MAWTTPRTYTVGELLTAADMNLYQRDNFEAVLPYGTTVQTYTPTLTASTTNPTLGSGAVQSGAYYRTGRMAEVWVRIRFGTSGTAAGAGTYFVSLPISADTTNLNAATSSLGSAIGAGHLRDNDTASNDRPFDVALASATTAVLVVTGGTVAAGTIPWAAEDQITFHAIYPAA